MFGLPKFGRGIGFHRVMAFCERRGISLDELSRRSLVITGSGGKGSTARFAYACLRTVFNRVGCFTSPHLYDFRERFELAGQRITLEAFEEYKQRALDFHREIADEGDGLGDFELLFLVAAQWFHDERADCMVWEAGIGGRYDTVRAVQAEIGALTSVELEHTELLGGTHELIAYDKLDAVRCGGRVLVSPGVDAALYPRLRAFAHLSGRKIEFLAETVAIKGARRAGAGMAFGFSRAGGPLLQTEIPLVGLFQVHNTVTGFAAAQAFASARGRPLDAVRAVEAMAHVDWPGRIEKVSDTPEAWIDVGHRPEGVCLAADEFLSMFDERELLVVFGISYNKRIKDVVRIVESRFSNIIITRAYKNGTDPERLLPEFSGAARIRALAPTIEEAVRVSSAMALAENRKIVVLGGLFLAIEFAHAMRGHDPRELEFF